MLFQNYDLGFQWRDLFCIYSQFIVPWIFRCNRHSNFIKDTANQIYGLSTRLGKYIRTLLAVDDMRVGCLCVVMFHDGLVYLSCYRFMWSV
jgi:hypothetical protein